MGDPTLGPLSAFMASVTWAVGSAQYSRMSLHHSAFAVNFVRAVFAFPLFALLAFGLAGGFSEGVLQFTSTVKAHHIGWFTLAMIASYGLGDVLFLWSTARIGVPAALAIGSCYPLWTAAAGVFFRGEVLLPLQAFGVLLAVSGVVGVILSAPIALKQGSLPAAAGRPVLKVGIALALGTSFLWALNSYATSHAGRDLSMPVANTIRMALAMGLSAGFARLLAPKMPILIPFRNLRPFFWILALEAFGGSCFYVYGIANSPLAVGATLTSLAPVISVPVAWVLGLESPSIPRTLAVFATVSGILLLVGGAPL